MRAVQEFFSVLSPQIQVALWLRDARRRRQMSQRQLAREVQFAHSYVGQVERGARPPSQRYAERCAAVLGLELPGNVEWPRRGRPKRSSVTRKVLRDLRLSEGLQAPAHGGGGEGRVPFHPAVEKAPPIDDPYDGICNKLGGPPAADYERLKHEKKGEFWRRFNAIPYDSWSEKAMPLRLAVSEADLVGVRPGEVGCALPVRQARTGRCQQQKAQPAFVFKWDELSVVCWPQRRIITRSQFPRVDGLLVAAAFGRKVTAVLECDGPQSHQDKRRDAARDREIGVPVLRFRSSEYTERGMLEQALGQMRQMLKTGLASCERKAA